MSPGPLQGEAYAALATESLERFIAELSAHGVRTDPALRLETSRGVISYYDRAQVLISVATPDASGAGAALQTLYLRSVLGFDDDSALDALIRFCVPFTVAHELGHHLRHHYGHFGADLWEEERVANLLASALQKRRYSPVQRRDAVELLGRALQHLAPRVASNDEVVDSYGSLLAALNVAGLITGATLSGIALIQKYTTAASTEKSGGELLPVELLRRLEHRERLVREFSETYSSDVLRYVYYQLGWLFISMASGESFHLDSLAREHLGIARAVVAPPKPAAVPDAAEVRALYAASLIVAPRSAVCATYFDLRYRDALLALLGASTSAALRRAGAAAANLVSTMGPADDLAGDPLDLIAPLLPARERELLPAALMATAPQDAAELAASLVVDTDGRLFDHVALGVTDVAAADTLTRLSVLWAVEIFSRLSPEVALSLIDSLAAVHVPPGQTVIWEGDNDLDVYCVQRGQVEVIDAAGDRLRLIGEGGMFGEIPYLLRRGRSKTVRAIEPTVLLAIPERELSYLVHRHPEIGLQIARTLASRLN